MLHCMLPRTIRGRKDNKMKTSVQIMLGLLSSMIFTTICFASEGKAMIKGTAPDSTVEGWVTFKEADGGLKVEAEIKNVAPAGKHGFHIHEKGSCDDTGKAAGGHFNPDGVQHGMLEKDGHEHAHAGDLGNIEIKE